MPRFFASLSATLLAASVGAFLFASPAAAQCVTARVNVDSAGVQADATSAFNSPAVARNFLSGNGRLVAFWSPATNLVPNDTNGVNDVFVHDRVTGITTRISVDSSGVEANGASSDPAFSADGRFVAYQSAATNLVAGDTNGRLDVFVRDLVLSTTVRVSVDSAGAETNHDSARPDISADGRFVAFHSRGTTLTASDANGNVQDLFLRDMQTSVTELLSVDSAGVQGNAFSGNPSISANGRWVAFHSSATNLVVGDFNLQTDVFVRDRQTSTTTRVNTNSLDEECDFVSQTPSISADGRYVAFSSAATNLVPTDNNNLFDVFVKDRATGQTRIASIASIGTLGNSISQGNSISADGRYVAFVSSASNLVANDTNGGPLSLLSDVFVRDMVTGNTQRLSVDTAGVQGDMAGSSFNVCVSPDGSTVAFYSGASNLVAGDTNGFIDVFTRSCGGAPAPTAYCSGDGTATACPCGNTGGPGRGCANSFTTGGLLSASGVSSVSADTFTLAVSGLPDTATALYFQGDQQVASGAGAVFGDGLRCAGGSVQRMIARFSVAGASQFGHAVAGDTPVSIAGNVPAGTVSIRFYQAWYRNLAAFCTPQTYNLTNGLTVTWIP